MVPLRPPLTLAVRKSWLHSFMLLLESRHPLIYCNIGWVYPALEDVLLRLGTLGKISHLDWFGRDRNYRFFFSLLHSLNKKVNLLSMGLLLPCELRVHLLQVLRPLAVRLASNYGTISTNLLPSWIILVVQSHWGKPQRGHKQLGFHFDNLHGFVSCYVKLDVWPSKLDYMGSRGWEVTKGL